MKQAEVQFHNYTVNRFQKMTDSNGVVVAIKADRLKAKAWARELGQTIEDRFSWALSRQAEPLKAGSVLKCNGRQKSEADLWLAVLPEDARAFDYLGFARSIMKSAVDKNVEGLSVVCLEKSVETLFADTFAAALGTHTFLMPSFGKRAEKVKEFRLKSINFFSAKNTMKVLYESFHSAFGTNLVRYLGTLPPNMLNPKQYAEKIQALCKAFHLSYKFISNKELKKMGAGAFTAVDRGDPHSQGGIFEIHYTPKSAKNKNWISLVGKGLCFDTGGYDIKTGGYMMTMKGDMQGSALALSNLVVASKLRLPLKMKAYLAVTENHISPLAYKADEVVTALNGMSIEVINTDAEGRMVLADTLSLASRAKPELIIDFATLTGAATVALGQSMSAAFTNRDDWHSKIVDAGRESGERVWTFPLDKDYGKALESSVADIIQCIKGRGPDHIYAAYFLKEFVEKDVPWVHIDLAAADKEGGLAHVDTLFTGFGVRWTMKFLKNKYKI